MMKLENRPNPRVRVLSAMFCAGFFSILAQVLSLRELLVIFVGNELTIGAILGFWLVGIGLGSLAALMFLGRIPSDRTRQVMMALLSASAFLLPLQVMAIRHLRFILGAHFGEQISFGGTLLGAAGVLAPVCLVTGAVFPCACQVAAERCKHAVNRVYASDALGGMAGGALFSFFLARLISSLAAAAIAGAFALAGAALLARGRLARRVLAAAAVCMAFAGPFSPLTARLEWAGVQARWRSFGYLPSSGERGGRLLCSTDSRYQNLALIEDEGQNTLYGNGRVMFIFPDTAATEHRIHFIMAQNPAAGTVLLIGGCPATDIPQLLKYPIHRLAHVELDEKIEAILKMQADPAYLDAISDPRLIEHSSDGPRFVKTCLEQFDVVIIMAPLPATMAFNRYYTAEFYADVSRVLAPGGFLHTSIESSEHLAEETAGLAASVHKALLSVFDRVLFTAGDNIQFFAGTKEAPLTLDREILFQRSAAAELRNDYFRPSYFLAAEEIHPDRLDFIGSRLSRSRVSKNTLARPISTLYSLLLWSRFSGSRLQPFFAEMGKARAAVVSGSFLLVGAAALAFGALLRLVRKASSTVSVSVFVRGWSRTMLGVSVASTGCCEMALQIMLIFLFQGLFGYVYERIGLIAALYMMGLALGASSATWMAGRNRAWPCMFGLESLIMVIAAGMPFLTSACSRAAAPTSGSAAMEAFFHVLFVLTGWAGGAHFSLANRLSGAKGQNIGAIASLMNAADLVGASLGSVAVGILLLPILGLGSASLMLAAAKGGSALCVASALVAGSARSRPPVS